MKKYLSLWFLLKTLYWVEKPRKQLILPEFMSSCGTIIEELKFRRPALHYYPIYMLRRIFYAVVLIILYRFPILQLSLIIGIAIIPVFLRISDELFKKMFWYLIRNLPFNEVSNNVFNVYNEAALLVTFGSILIMNAFKVSEIVVKIWGWVLIGFILLSLAATWVLTLPSATMGMFKSVKNWIYGIKEAEVEENKIDAEFTDYEDNMEIDEVKQSPENIEKTRNTNLSQLKSENTINSVAELAAQNQLKNQTKDTKKIRKIKKKTKRKTSSTEEIKIQTPVLKNIPIEKLSPYPDPGAHKVESKIDIEIDEYRKQQVLNRTSARKNEKLHQGNKSKNKNTAHPNIHKANE